MARPIQMKAAWTRSFVIDQRYAKFPDLILAYVWHLDDLKRAVTYALSYAEALAIADTLGWTRTVSWVRGAYSTSSPSARLADLLEPYRMAPGRWWPKIVGQVAAPSQI